MQPSLRGASPRGARATRGGQVNEDSRSSASASASASSHSVPSTNTQQGRREEELKNRPVSRGRVLLAILRNPENSPVLTKFFIFAILMAVLPICTVLLLPRLVFTILKNLQLQSDEDGLEDTAKMCGNIAAVLLVNVVMLSYAFLAYREEKRDWEEVCRAQTSEDAAEQKDPEATITKKTK
ncbi:conserved hypothetical protein [Neospora caninum Liverpool]|uniref:VMA21-like domain protein n=1 Tax=Neospora caninum (strain Liverpool) TaxID=572307 RepID=F0VAL5_NEOCL|nr:conserved hypothetical protein [Neospora caninum Liverpool]CBZ50770.1 conserved hypothetical protein [Neospora caninum Liverpool]CEL68070.1 TPA: hypothetical protein BN1204_038450 [Neospora caninum Liverpool]|eukprot:XP_003880803.1 conserved hypothetical protein [Neospora caninum Liverpool]